MRCFAVLLMVAGVMMTGCHAPCKANLPPASMMMHPGPGVDGPGPGVAMYEPGGPSTGMTSQIHFGGPEGMTVNWDVAAPGAFDSQPVVCPANYNFPQGAIYRLRLSNIPGREGVELYPTLEVAPTMPRTEAYLAHNNIPVVFTPEDFDQVISGNFVTKVLYLPDPNFQELALAGVETLVSTRLEPGVDPIVEADRRGAILAIVRLGNKDLQAPGGHNQDGMVTPASYEAYGPGRGSPMGPVSGVTTPQYGMAMCGTPIGLPGPPSVPLGVPAGLYHHEITNHTHVCLPAPTQRVCIDVKQEPGITYPKPVDHVSIIERTRAGCAGQRGCDGGQCTEGCEEECPRAGSQ
jgi:hypothetical protein